VIERLYFLHDRKWKMEKPLLQMPSGHGPFAALPIGGALGGRPLWEAFDYVDRAVCEDRLGDLLS
jgi:hypothetical protein